MTDSILTREPIDGLLESGLEHLVFGHWKEIAHDQEKIELAPHWDFYRTLERVGGFAGFGLRRADELIGYTGYFLAPHPHYKNHIFATNDVIYLRPDERGMEGVVMILEAEKWLKAHNVAKVFYHTKVDAFLGSVSGDSLEAINDVLEIETRTGLHLNVDLPGDDRTLGAVLKALGYKLAEMNYGKLLI